MVTVTDDGVVVRVSDGTDQAYFDRARKQGAGKRRLLTLALLVVAGGMQ